MNITEVYNQQARGALPLRTHAFNTVIVPYPQESYVQFTNSLPQKNMPFPVLAVVAKSKFDNLIKYGHITWSPIPGFVRIANLNSINATTGQHPVMYYNPCFIFGNNHILCKS